MKSYLSLIPISAKVHRRENRMTQLCIIFSVFLVTSIFSMADAGIKMEKIRLIEKHGEKAVENIGTSGAAQSFYIIAGILFVLILIAGILMIAGSINSNVAKRTRFFGMMRCIGMSKKQIVRFVRLEALNWCKSAVPAGIVLGIAVTWILCAGLRFAVGGEFSQMPLFSVSITGIISGAVIGVMTVLIAAGAPAKRAAKVSPAAASSGNYSSGVSFGAAKTSVCRIDMALGVHHAVSDRKKLFLMTGSFALSIVLFLCFSVFIDFVGFIMPQNSNAADINISSIDAGNSIDERYVSELEKIKGVKNVFGRKNEINADASLMIDGKYSKEKVDIVSFDEFDIRCLKKDGLLERGSDIADVYGNNGVLAISGSSYKFKKGDVLKLGSGDFEVEVSGNLKFNIFGDNGKTEQKPTIIMSPSTFKKVTGMTGYSLMMIQTDGDFDSASLEKVENMLSGRAVVKDNREYRTESTYMAFKIFIYGFISIITLVTVLNIMNSISMSVSSRIRQYGIMRAVGMDVSQITGMIASEAFTYAVFGCITGCVAGFFASRCLYITLITSHFPYAVWSVPVLPLAVILLFVAAATALSVYGPSKRIKNMAVTETINEL